MLSKILQKSIRDDSFVRLVITALESLGIEYLDLPDWSKIIENVKKYNIDVEDSIHVTTALENKLEIISNDKELKKKVNAEF